ncbi:CG5815 [Drosophila busckii]|uniref:Protein SPT2 homolog n=1 Tax=Drosophila busckii TaxID=30019 RepID=A0A0M4EIE0_DROBS|nr:protein SPT2 homolog [Drosophila busckii]ALC48641.1 CG5815 [Drosophila busckii]
MDFDALLTFAKKKNEAATKDEGKFYSTKYAPPKKESKESKQLSQNIQKFLKKREAEEKERKHEERAKVASLLAMRDDKSKNKIRKMLKVTKSANKSVLEDAKDSSNNQFDAEGGEGDDYGYVSNEANALYAKYLEKVKDVQEDKGFAPSRPQSLRDLSGTKERVKAAITREIEDTKCGTRQRISNVPSTSSSSSKPREASVARAYTSSSRKLYDPEEEQRQKRAEEQAKRAKIKRSAQPPPMDFQALLRLAEQKQHEPVVFEVPEKKKEPERLLSAREKREQEERQRAKEERAQRDRQRELDLKAKEQQPAAPTRMEPNGRIPKLNKAPASKSPITASSASSSAAAVKSKSSGDSAKSGKSKIAPSTMTRYNNSVTKNSVASKPASSSSLSSSSNSAARRPTNAPPAASSASSASTSSTAARNPYTDANKNGKAREFPPRDPAKTRAFPPNDVQRAAQRKQMPGGRGAQAARSRPPAEPGQRRIYDDDSEYDSELDDFIDDGDCEEDISSHIRDIFGYDKRRYRDLDEDDKQMESSFAQVQREEFISKKIGFQEDLEDMRMEAMHKKRKMAKKRTKPLADDDDD